MAVAEDREGFLLSEVPFGDGILDLPRVIGAIRSARPQTRFTLEMITRDPLRVPCLAPSYWTTFPDRPAPDLARTLRLVRDRATPRPLPRISGLARAEVERLEEQNVLACLAHAREKLGL
jgi:hypothetical protein